MGNLSEPILNGNTAAKAGPFTRWRPLRGLEFDASIYLNDSKVTERFTLQPFITSEKTGGYAEGSTAVSDVDLSDFKRLPNIADVTARVGFAYVTPLNDHWDVETNGFHTRLVAERS